MIELMNCQMCGAQPHFRDFDAYEERHAFTHNHYEVVKCSCGMSGQSSEWKRFKRPPRRQLDALLKKMSSVDRAEWIRDNDLRFSAHEDEQIPLSQDAAAIKWNTLQKLIARGKLLDEPDKAPRKAKRL